MVEKWGEVFILGLVEGLTEFLPVSSTGHLLLLGHFLGFKDPGRAFEVLIQLGAILAVVCVYGGRLFQLFCALPFDSQARRFFIGIGIAFLPAAFLGVAFHSVIKTVLFESPFLICTMLILGGGVLLILDRYPRTARHFDALHIPLPVCLLIGLCQALALVPGVSRAGATIAGALLVGVEKRAAAEFSFFLAIPTMLGAFVYDLYKNMDVLTPSAYASIFLGFVVAFVTAICVVRTLLAFVAQYGFAPFAYWRIAVGAIGILGLYLTGELS